jgi:uncharacterized membrane protein
MAESYYLHPAARQAKAQAERRLPIGVGPINVGNYERWVSGVGGSILLIEGLKRGKLGGLAMAAIGGWFTYRGLTGHCPVYQVFGIDTSTEGRGPSSSVPAQQGVKVEKSVTIQRTPDELFRFWRNFENLPRVMAHLETVKVIDDNRSHWVAKAPLGTSVEWDAVIHNERENELIAWRSLEGSAVDTAGSVHFRRAPGGRGTEVRVSLKYNPPAGKVGAAIAKLLGEDPAQEIQEDLRRFKQLMEAGEVATTDGQPSARRALTEHRR